VDLTVNSRYRIYRERAVAPKREILEDDETKRRTLPSRTGLSTKRLAVTGYYSFYHESRRAGAVEQGLAF
jgi:hypothetical protein